MTLSERQQIFTYNIHLLIEFAYKNGFTLSFGEATRPIEQVWLNFYGFKIVNNNGVLSLVKKTPTSKTLNSLHVDRLAVDFNIFKDGVLINEPLKIQPLGYFWMALNTDNIWGGDFDRDGSFLDESFIDAYHFQMRQIRAPIKVPAA